MSIALFSTSYSFNIVFSLTCVHVHDSPAHLHMPQLFTNRLMLACHHLCYVNDCCVRFSICFCNIQYAAATIYYLMTLKYQLAATSTFISAFCLVSLVAFYSTVLMCFIVASNLVSGKFQSQQKLL